MRIVRSARDTLVTLISRTDRREYLVSTATLRATALGPVDVALKELAALQSQGVLTDAEFNAEKAKLLAS
jgi:hypothetical protein